MKTPSTTPPAPRPSWPDIQTLREMVQRYKRFNDELEKQQRDGERR